MIDLIGTVMGDKTSVKLNNLKFFSIEDSLEKNCKFNTLSSSIKYQFLINLVSPQYM